MQEARDEVDIRSRFDDKDVIVIGDFKSNLERWVILTNTLRGIWKMKQKLQSKGELMQR